MFNRFRYKRAIFKALDRCREDALFGTSTRHQALRTIRDFERLNNIEFDPFDEVHVSTIEGMGAVGGRIRSINLKFKESTKTPVDS